MVLGRPGFKIVAALSEILSAVVGEVPWTFLAKQMKFLAHLLFGTKYGLASRLPRLMYDLVCAGPTGGRNPKIRLCSSSAGTLGDWFGEPQFRFQRLDFY